MFHLGRDGELEDVSESGSSSESEEEPEEAHPRGKKRKAGRTRQARPAKSRKRGRPSSKSKSRQPRNARDAASAEPPTFENFIYDSILDPEVSINELASEWIESYTENEVPALKDMVNFILKVRIFAMTVLFFYYFYLFLGV